MYRLYQADNTTPVAVSQQIDATFNPVSREPYNDGGVRGSAFYVVEWQFGYALSEAAYQALTLWTPESGRVQFDTWRGARGATASGFVKCEGIQEVVAGTLKRGEWHGVYVRFVAVRVL